MRPVYRTSIRALLVSAVLLGALASGGCEGGGAAPAAAVEAPADPFTFLRTREALVRVHSPTGQVTFSALDGEGGWLDLGSTPDSAGAPERPGRYNIVSAGTQKRLGPATMGRKQGLILMRMDTATGRAWLAPLRRSSEWQEIRDTASAEG